MQQISMLDKTLASGLYLYDFKNWPGNRHGFGAMVFTGMNVGMNM
jgi:hypothetical protein